MSLVRRSSFVAPHAKKRKMPEITVTVDQDFEVKKKRLQERMIGKLTELNEKHADETYLLQHRRDTNKDGSKKDQGSRSLAPTADDPYQTKQEEIETINKKLDYFSRSVNAVIDGYRD